MKSLYILLLLPVIVVCYSCDFPQNPTFPDPTPTPAPTQPYIPVAEWEGVGTPTGFFKGIALDSFDNVYVVDDVNDRVQKFSSDGTFITVWGISGSGNSQFNRPSGIAVDSQNYVYVADTDNQRVQKFTSDGVFVLKWGITYSGTGRMIFPVGIAIDSNGDVYVSDAGLERITKFDNTGFTILTRLFVGICI